MKFLWKDARRFLFPLTSWIIRKPQSVVFTLSLLLIGVGLGWWIHPGCGLMTTGAIPLSLMVYARVSQLHQQKEEA